MVGTYCNSQQNGRSNRQCGCVDIVVHMAKHDGYHFMILRERLGSASLLTNKRGYVKEAGDYRCTMIK